MENPLHQPPGDKKSLKNKRFDQWAQDAMANITPGEIEASAVFVKYFRYTYEYAKSLSDDFSVAELQFAHHTAVHDVYMGMPLEIRKAFEEYAARKQENEGGPQKEKA